MHALYPLDKLGMQAKRPTFFDRHCRHDDYIGVLDLRNGAMDVGRQATAGCHRARRRSDDLDMEGR